jgi:hypothetical protein
VAPVDLTGVPVVDNHCHPVERVQQHTDVRAWRGLFTESVDPVARAQHAADTAFYRRLLTAMAELYGMGGDDPDEAAVLTARARLSTPELVSTLFRGAGIEALVVDTGFPPPAITLAASELTAAGGVRQASLLRLELLFQDLITRAETLDELIELVDDELADVRAPGWAGFKTIAGYRTGLGITRWSNEDARTSFGLARAEVSAAGAVRLGHKPLLDTLLHRAFRAASAQELPVQVHVGYGDADVDLRAASPLELREVLHEPEYRGMAVVLLHGCWPYFREGAYLAAVHDNVHLDLSYAIPFLSVAEMTSMTRAALGAAPFGKLMYSSDGARVPELHWLGARDGRRVLGTCLGELVADGDLSSRQAEDVGERILAGNARTLYGLG